MTRILLKGGCVLTLGARSANLRLGDVLIEDTFVAEVGVGLRARDAEQIDATDTIVMPGFVDTHRHAWTSLFRNLGDRSSDGRPLASAQLAECTLNPYDPTKTCGGSTCRPLSFTALRTRSLP